MLKDGVLAFTTGEEELLATKPKLHHNKLQESERAQRKRALFHISRVIRFLPAIFRKTTYHLSAMHVIDRSR